MADPINFTPYLGWQDVTDPNNIPEGARLIGASDLKRYEQLGVDVTARLNDVPGMAEDLAPEIATSPALSATYAGLIQLAKNPDTLIAGAVTVDSNNLVTSAAVLWPDSTPGTLTITSRDTNGAVLAYNITYGSPVTKTFTQPTITRNSAGAATNVPQIVVS